MRFISRCSISLESSRKSECKGNGVSSRRSVLALLCGEAQSFLAVRFQYRTKRGRFAYCVPKTLCSKRAKVFEDSADESPMTPNCPGRVTLGDLRPQGLLDLYRQGTTWVAAIRLRDGRLTNLALEESVTTRKAALQFLQIELSKFAQSPIPR
jgi:hypothetical protein